jgi:phage-related protein
MKVREIVFYEAPNGEKPVEKFLDSLPAKQAQKAAWVLQLIEDLDRVPIQYFKKLDGTDDLWEVRIDLGSNAFRLLGFMHLGNLVILTNGFVKKTQKTPVSEIAIAEQRKSEYLRRRK